MQPQTPSFLFVSHQVFAHKNKHFAPALHRDFPLCDPQVGRPTIEMLRCYHLGCGEKFSNGAALANHLEFNSAYRRGYVKEHDAKYPVSTKLEKKCEICKVEFESEGAMREHLARMGLKGYWTKGVTYQEKVEEIRKAGKTEYEVLMGEKQKVKSKLTLDPKTFDKIFQTQHCLICEDKRPEVLYQGCKHMNICYNCFKLLQIRDTCIFCKTTSFPQLFKISPEVLEKLKI